MEEDFAPEIFDDREAPMRNNVDMDIFDSARALVDDGVDLDDRAAVERMIIALGVYRQPETFQRFVDAVIAEAKSIRETNRLFE
jgi:hypothetical protein